MAGGGRPIRTYPEHRAATHLHKRALVKVQPIVSVGNYGLDSVNVCTQSGETPLELVKDKLD